MSGNRSDRQQVERRLRETEERFRVAQAASGIGWFEWDLTTDWWEWTPPVAALFGFDPGDRRSAFQDWESAIFIDDVPKVRAAANVARETGAFYAEFRVSHLDDSVHWIAGKGEVSNNETALPSCSSQFSAERDLFAPTTSWPIPAMAKILPTM